MINFCSKKKEKEKFEKEYQAKWDKIPTLLNIYTSYKEENFKVFKKEIYCPDGSFWRKAYICKECLKK